MTLSDAPARADVPGQRRPQLRALVAVGIAAVVVLAAVGAPLADEDSPLDVVRSLRRLTELTGDLRWPFVIALIGCAFLHYVCAAIALQAAAGCRLPLGRRVLAQLAASTANRVTPAGLGGSAVNVRFLVASRQLTSSRAVGAVAALAVIGAVADLVVLGCLVVGALVSGVRPPPAETAAVRQRFAHLLTNAGVTGVAIGALGALLVLLARYRFRSRGGRPRLWDVVRPHQLEARRQMARLAQSPRSLARAFAGTAGTTLLMAVGLALAVAAVPGPIGHPQPLLLVIAYLVGAAAGSAAPTPGGLGVTEAGLTAALSYCTIPSVHAIQSVLLFRMITFWAPAIVGLLAAKYLRTRLAL